MLIKLLANLPFSLIAIIMSLTSGIKSIKLHKSPPALILNVHSFWYRTWRKTNRGVRASALGNVVILGPKLFPRDLEHELVHIEQAMREPLIHPILYWLETKRHGYKSNKYEVEAYARAGNTYLE